MVDVILFMLGITAFIIILEAITFLKKSDSAETGHTRRTMRT